MKLPLQIAFATYALGLALLFASESSAREVASRHHNHFNQTFVDQLRRVFGAFRDADLKRVFDTAHPIRCSDLVGDTGEWREVAFFNGYRDLGGWYRTSLDDVRGDLAAYIFRGTCAAQSSSVQVTTRFPVEESVNAYENGKIDVRDVDVNVNPPVTASFDNQTLAYTFDLPYLFRVSDRNANSLYALSARRRSDQYASEVTNRWECKSVADATVTYDFLICHTTLVWRHAEAASRGAGASYGTSAFSILSDGKAASSSVKLTFENSGDLRHVTEENRNSVPRSK